MKKLLFGVIATVMVSGLLLGSMGSDVFALSEKGAEKGQAKGCNDNNPGQAKNNPHCETIDQCTDPVIAYHDGDRDGFGDPFHTETQCIGEEWVADNTDCDDNSADVNPTATEITGNEIDENCNGSLEN
jgi:hypothetical protein